MKLKVLVSESFNKSFDNLCSLKTIPAPTMFILRGMRKKLSEEIEKYSELRTEYVKEFAQKDNEGNLIYVKENIVKLQDSKACNAKIGELEKTEVEMVEISFSDLGKEPALTPDDLYNLEFIVE